SSPFEHQQPVLALGNRQFRDGIAGNLRLLARGVAGVDPGNSGRWGVADREFELATGAAWDVDERDLTVVGAGGDDGVTGVFGSRWEGEEMGGGAKPPPGGGGQQFGDLPHGEGAGKVERLVPGRRFAGVLGGDRRPFAVAPAQNAVTAVSDAGDGRGEETP